MTHVGKKIIRVAEGKTTAKEDWLAREQPLTITINKEQYITLLATAQNLEELAVGFAYNEGLISNKKDIRQIALSPDNNSVELSVASEVDLTMRLAKTRLMSTGCGKGSSYYRAIDSLTIQPVSPGINLHWRTINQLMLDFNKMPSHLVEVGSVHGAALARDTIQVFREDVARHNTVDKLVGHLILAEKPGSDYALITSGRITSELILKAVRIDIGLLISRSAPSELATNLANKLGVTLVGFARGRKFNIYTHPQRIGGRESTSADRYLEAD